jgi:hypothetical protein
VVASNVYVGKADGSKWSTCPKGTTPANANNLWCLVKPLTFVNPQSGSADFTFTPDTPGEFNVVVNGKTQGNARTCTGNPTCTFNGGSVTCDAGLWYDCGANDNISIVAKQFDGACTTFTAKPTSVELDQPVLLSWSGVPVGATTGGRYTIRLFESATQKYIDKIQDTGYDMTFSHFESSGAKTVLRVSCVCKFKTYKEK